MQINTPLIVEPPVKCIKKFLNLYKLIKYNLYNISVRKYHIYI